MNISDLDKTCILEMCGGGILERADYEMGKVIANIMDPNTKATAKRKITITLELTPSADRNAIVTNITAKSTLAATEPILTTLYVTRMPGSSEMVVAEMVPQVPGQMNVDGGEQEGPKILKFVAQS